MKKDYVDIDLKKKPLFRYSFLYIVAKFLSVFLSIYYRQKYVQDPKVKELKSPFILLANHASFSDFVSNLRMFKHSRINWVTSVEEFYNNGEWVMRNLGCYPKRKFVPDVVNVMHMLDILRHGNILCIYPEVRFSLAGINEHIDLALGKFVKKAGVPVVLQLNYGHWLQSPQHIKHPYRHPKMVSKTMLLISKEEVKTMSAEEIQKKIEDNFVYDEYQFQQEEGFKLKCKKRMEKIETILYKCPHCGTEFEMVGKGIQIKCKHCGVTYEQDVYGTLHNLDGDTKFKSIQDWYRWEREETNKEVRLGTYHLEDDIVLKRLFKPRVGFIKYGQMKFVHDYEGMHVTGNCLDGEPFEFHRSVDLLPSVHIEYRLKDKKDNLKSGAIDFANTSETYFGWLVNKSAALTKIHFATEEMYSMYREKLQKNK